VRIDATGRPMMDGGVHEGDDWGGGFGVIRAGWQLYLGSVGRAAEHAHHAIQIIVADGPLVLQDGAGRRHRSASAIIPANAPHTIAKGNSHAAMLYLDPESAASRALDRRASGDTALSVCTWIDGARELTPALLPSVQAVDKPERLVDRILAALGVDANTVPGAAMHPALERALLLLPTILDGPVRMATVAAETGISASRLRHLFVAELGLPFRRYVLWLRLQRAAQAVFDGASLTDAAHAAGFTDSAHLTHTTRRMFGLPPSQLAKAVTPFPQWV
jgi:AraC-like DNA-binding protein